MAELLTRKPPLPLGHLDPVQIHRDRLCPENHGHLCLDLLDHLGSLAGQRLVAEIESRRALYLVHDRLDPRLHVHAHARGRMASQTLQNESIL